MQSGELEHGGPIVSSLGEVPSINIGAVASRIGEPRTIMDNCDPKWCGVECGMCECQEPGIVCAPRVVFRLLVMPRSGVMLLLDGLEI